MLKCLYRVIVDGREMFIVGKDEKEVEKFCFMLFDYTKIYMSVVKKGIRSDFPYIISRKEYYYA